MRMTWLAGVALIATFGAATAHADLKKDFGKLNNTYKGPFGPNVLQGSRGRAEIRAGGSAPGTPQFQAAFRNDTARALAVNDGFWTGNLFTTNYYELTGEYVWGDAYGSHDIAPDRLVAAGAQARAKASSMVRHWVLEKHYLSYARSKYTEGFLLRGISDSANETEYANHFFNFYVTVARDEYEYLPAFILVNKSPIVESASLGRARDLVAQAYDMYNQGFGADQQALADMYKLRNAIHNQLSREVIGHIDQFLAKYPQFRGDGYFDEIRKILVDYYAINAGKIAQQAKNLGMSDVNAAAAKVAKASGNVDALQELARAAAGWRTNIATQIPLNKRGQALAVLADVSKVLNNQLSSLPASAAKSPKALEAVLNTVYLEGFLIKDNVEYFKREIASSSNPAGVLRDALDAASDTLAEAFKPAFAQWVSVDSKMNGFMDNAIKSSALNTVSVTIEKIKR